MPAAHFDFDKEHKVMTMFIDNAKSYIQLSGAALVLSVTFIREIVGLTPGAKMSHDSLMIAAWVAFLLAIVSGAFYQYLAVKYLERHLSGVSLDFWDRLAQQPGLVYGLMLTAFYGGAVLFTVDAIVRLSRYS